jgi:hypothetical protein
LVTRHEVLRTRFAADDGVPRQVIDPPPGDAPLRVVDLTALPTADRESEMLGHLNAQAASPLDLEAGPTLSALLVRLSDDDHVVMVDMHHICTDGWSPPSWWVNCSRSTRAANRRAADPIRRLRRLATAKPDR